MHITYNVVEYTIKTLLRLGMLLNTPWYRQLLMRKENTAGTSRYKRGPVGTKNM